MRTVNILYIHGMGGGGDSRIPSILKEWCGGRLFQDKEGALVSLEVIVRTYSFDPEEASKTISEWVKELSPSLVIGESLGSIQAVRIKGLPHILVSPSLGAPLWLYYSHPLMYIPGLRPLLNKVYKPREGDRQKIDFNPRILKKYRSHLKAALSNSPRAGGVDTFFAFFGKKDHYRKWGVVSVKMYEKWFGKSYAEYDGTHFMEEEWVLSLLTSKIQDTLSVLPQ